MSVSSKLTVEEHCKALAKIVVPGSFNYNGRPLTQTQRSELEERVADSIQNYVEEGYRNHGWDLDGIIVDADIVTKGGK